MSLDLARQQIKFKKYINVSIVTYTTVDPMNIDIGIYPAFMPPVMAILTHSTIITSIQVYCLYNRVAGAAHF